MRHVQVNQAVGVLNIAQEGEKHSMFCLHSHPIHLDQQKLFHLLKKL